MKTLHAVVAALAILSAAPAYAVGSGLKVVAMYKIGGTGGWDYDNYDSVSHRLFITHGTSIAAVDTLTGKVTPHLADAGGAHIALPLADGKTVLLTQGKLNKASFIDAVTGVDLVDVPTAGKPDGAILDPLTGRVFVLDNDSNEIDVIDPVTRSLIGKIALAGAPESGAADGSGLLYTHLEDKNAIVVIDTKALTVKTTYALNDCNEPSGLALVTGQNLLLSACKDGFARVTDATTGAEVAHLPIGLRADGALYDAKTKRGYIPSGVGTLTVISFDGAPRVIEVVTTRPGARTAALDPETGRIFLPYADLLPPAKAGERPSAIPDTFAVLVLGQ